MTMLLAALSALGVTLHIPWSGAWSADVEYDLGAAGVELAGRNPLVIDVETLVGTIDPKVSGRIGSKGSARLVAGGGGWESVVEAKDYANDAGVFTTNVFTTTAAEVGEVVVETLGPQRLGEKYVRFEGPASSVLEGVDWHVDFKGVTQVGPRMTLPADPTKVTVLEWDASTRVAEIATDSILVPGTILTDARFGTILVRDVEQSWNDGGARARAWCVPVDQKPEAGASAGSGLVGALGELARHATGAALMNAYRYRVVSQGPDGRCRLQAVRPATGMPNIAQCRIAFGMPGLEAKLKPGSIVFVEFPEGDKTLPRVVAFDASVAVELSFTALTKIALAAPSIEASRLTVGAGRAPALLATQTMVQWIAAITVAVNTLAPGSATAPTDAAATLLMGD